MRSMLANRPDGKTGDIKDFCKQAKLINAVKTPYLANGKMDLVTYDRILDNLIAVRSASRLG